MADEGELLPEAEIERITRRERPTAQARALKRMGIPCRLEHGVVIASKQHLREWIAGQSQTAADAPNWGAVN